MPAAIGFVGGMFSFGGGMAFAAGGALSVGWAAGAAFGSTLIGGLTVKLLTSVAISALNAALTHEPQQGGGLLISSTVRGEDNPETIILGRYATSGQHICPPYSHGPSNRYLTQVIELCSAPGATLERVMIGDEWVELGATPHASYGYPVLGDKYLGNIWVKYYDGTQTVADPMMRAQYGSHPDRPWTADMVGHGICYAILTFLHDQESLTQVPRFRFELRGIPLYDPRKDSTVGGSGSQRIDQPATWTQSDNAILLAWNVMRGIALPGGGIWGGRISDMRLLPSAVWIAAMNRCDVLLDRGDGVMEPTYRAGIEVALDQPPAATLEELFKAASAVVSDLGYGWGVVAGAPGLPVYSITDDDIIVSRKQELDPFPSLQDSYNAVTGKYPSPEHFWETKECPKITNPLWEAADTFGRRLATVSLPAVPYPHQAQRIIRAWIYDERNWGKHVISTGPDSAHVEPTDTIVWASARNGYTSKAFTASEIQEDPRTGIRQLSIREGDPGNYDWKPSFVLPTAPAPTPVTITYATVDGFGALPVIAKDTAGNDRRGGIRLVWSEELDADGLEWRIRLAGETAVAMTGTVQAIRAGNTQIFDGLVPEQNYQVQARLILGRPSEWTTWRPVTTPAIKLDLVDLAPDVAGTMEEAIGAADAAAAAAALAQAAKNAAEAGAALADTAKAQAQAARDQSLTYRAAAQAAQTASETARNQAQTHATNASGSATAAAGSASNANTKATEAGNSATAAAGSVVAATSAKDAAQASATASASSASSAATSAGSAADSATAAETSRLTAATLKGQAEIARDAAVTAQTTAAGHASSASTSSTTAAASYQNAVMIAGNPSFDDGYVGWRVNSVVPGTDLSGTHGAISSGVFTSTPGVQRQLYQRKLHRLDPARKYRIRTRFSVIGAACRVYVGYQAADNTGAPTGGNSGRVYNVTNLVFAASETPYELSSPVFDLAGVKAAGTSSDFSGAVGLYLLALLNYDAAEGGQVALDGIWLEDVTEIQAAGTHATAAADSATLASTAASSAQGYASTALDYRNTAARLMSGGVSKNPVFNLWSATNPDNLAVSLGTGNSIIKKTAGVRYINAAQLNGVGSADGPTLTLGGANIDCSSAPLGILVRMEIEVVSIADFATWSGYVTGIWNDNGSSRFARKLLRDHITNTAGVVQTVEVYIPRPTTWIGTGTQAFSARVGARQATGTGGTIIVHRFDFEEVLANSATSIYQQAAIDLGNIQSAVVGLRAVAGSSGAELELVSLSGPTGSASAARLRADSILFDGTVQTKHMDVEWLTAGRLKSEYLDVTSLLTLGAGAGLSYGKLSAGSPNDGIYFGFDGGSFGLAASRTSPAGRQQEVALTSTGFTLKNAKHTVSGAVAPAPTNISANVTKKAMPTGTKKISVELIGGGASGGGSSSQPNNAGGSTTVRLYDGTTLKNTFTAAAGSGGIVYAAGTVPSGFWSNRGAGGARGSYTTERGGTKYGLAGTVGKVTNSGWIDVSTWANPQYEVVIGAGGVATAGSDASNGVAGGAVCTFSIAEDIVADVVPLKPTATGSFVTTGASGTFPDLGPGLWVLQRKTDAYGIGLGYVTVAPGTELRINEIEIATFFSSQTPTYASVSYSPIVGQLSGYFKLLPAPADQFRCC